MENIKYTIYSKFYKSETFLLFFCLWYQLLYQFVI